MVTKNNTSLAEVTRQSQSWGFYVRPVQQPGSYLDRPSALPLMGLKPTEVIAHD